MIDILNFVYELFLVIIVILFGTLLSCIFANSILKHISVLNSKKISMKIISIILYLSIVVFLLYFIRLTLKKNILNDDLINSGFFIVGPIIALFILHKLSTINKLFFKQTVSNF